MPDPNLHWDGRQWLRWDGSDWVPDPSIPPPTVPASGSRTALIVGLVIAVIAVGAGVVWLMRGPVAETAAPAGNQVVTIPIGGAQDAFTESVGNDLTFQPKTTSSPVSVSGGKAGLYGGTRDEGSCDREKLISFLEANPEKAAAWAGVFGIDPAQIRKFVMGTTPMLLRRDTYVTNHGYVDGRATSFPSVLQAGTAVLVGRHGLPVVRCYCGNPLTEPSAVTTDVTFTGTTWPGWNPRGITLVTRQTAVVLIFILVDVRTGERFVRPTGTDGSADRPVTVPPTTPPPPSTAPPPPSPSVTDYPTDYPDQYPDDYCDLYPEDCMPDYPTDYPDEYPTDAVG